MKLSLFFALALSLSSTLSFAECQRGYVSAGTPITCTRTQANADAKNMVDEHYTLSEVVVRDCKSDGSEVLVQGFALVGLDHPSRGAFAPGKSTHISERDGTVKMIEYYFLQTDDVAREVIKYNPSTGDLFMKFTVRNLLSVKQSQSKSQFKCDIQK